MVVACGCEWSADNEKKIYKTLKNISLTTVSTFCVCFSWKRDRNFYIETLWFSDYSLFYLI